MYDATGKKLSKTVQMSGGTPVQRQINGNPILSQEYEATESILSQGKVANGGDVTFSAGEYICLQPGFEASTNSDFLARITPIVDVGGTSTIRDYCMGLEYNNGVLEANYFTGGRVVFDEASNSEYQYAITDYQGNTRSLFKDNGSGVAEEVEHYDYYPFGALHSQETDLASKYTFGGKELQTELDLDWSDFGTRCFDAWSAKWQGVDILAEAKPFMSPYSYGLGNPIRFSDPSWMIEEDQDGLMSVSTSLWGRDVTGGENTGEVLDSKFLSEGQKKRDTDTYTFNKHAGDEVSKEVTDNGVNFSYTGVWERDPPKYAFLQLIGRYTSALGVGGTISGALGVIMSEDDDGKIEYGLYVTGSLGGAYGTPGGIGGAEFGLGIGGIDSFKGWGISFGGYTRRFSIEASLPKDGTNEQLAFTGNPLPATSFTIGPGAVYVEATYTHVFKRSHNVDVIIGDLNRRLPETVSRQSRQRIRSSLMDLKEMFLSQKH